MARVTCPQCDRTIPPDTIQAGVAFCPFCGWQQERNDVRSAGSMAASVPAKRPDPPVEDVSFTLQESIGRFFGSVIVMNTLLASMIGGLAAFLFLSFALAGQVPVIAVPACAAMISGVMWLFASIVTVPVMLYFTLFLRLRHFEAEGTLLHMQTGRKRKTIDLTEYSWQRCGKVASDSYGSYFWTRPQLKVVSEKVEYALGFDEDVAAKWIEYFQAVGVEESLPVQWRRVLALSMVASFIGGAIGTALEPLFAVPKGRQGSVIFIGFLDGFLSALIYLQPRARRKLGTNRFVCAATMTVLFAGIGLKAGGIFGWQVYSVNAILGAVAGWFIWLDEGATGRKSGP